MDNEYKMCFTYERGRECCGTSGRKLRSVCVYCPNYRPKTKKGDDSNVIKGLADDPGDTGDCIRTGVSHMGADAGNQAGRAGAAAGQADARV